MWEAVGTLLLERGLELIPAGAAARLDATPAGEVLYRKLGFVAEYDLARWFLDGKRQSVGGEANARRIVLGDWPAIQDMDARAFGASRARLLQRLADEAPEYAWVVEQGGRLQGYLFGRHGHVREHLGPLVADSAATASWLLDAFLSANPGRAVFVDAPDDQSLWRAELVERGFALERPFLRMHRGRLETPGEPSQIHAVTGPEFG